MKNKSILAIIICLFFSIISNGQEKNDYDIRFGIFTNWGMSTLGDNSGLNKYLSDRMYPEVSTLQGSFNRLELESRYKKIAIKLQDYQTFTINSSINSSDYTSGLNINGNIGYVGYIVFARNNFYLYPMVGYESSNASLKLSSPNENNDFEDFIDSSNKTNLNKSLTALRLEISFRGMLNEYSGFVASLGYRYKYSEENWKYHDMEILDGPELSINGVYLNFGVQINTIIFKTIFNKSTNR